MHRCIPGVQMALELGSGRASQRSDRSKRHESAESASRLTVEPRKKERIAGRISEKREGKGVREGGRTGERGREGFACDDLT